MTSNALGFPELIDDKKIREQKKLIVVCTQSNVAVDIILGRFLEKWDRFGYKSLEHLKSIILRVTAPDYNPDN